MRSAPGDPAVLLAGPDAPPEFVNQLRQQMGLDRPIQEQFLVYLSNALRGDLGQSYSFHAPVVNVIFSALPATLLLMGTAYVFALFVGVFGGISAAKKPYSTSSNLALVSSLIIYCIPGFWVAMIFAYFFGVILHWFPVQGMSSLQTTGIAYVGDVLYHLVLPALIISLEQLAIYFRITRATMLEVLNEDYMVAARAKGCDERSLFYKHALRNAMLPLITIVALRLTYVFAGAVLVETVFSWPGLGRLITNSIYQRDYNLLMGVFTIVAMLTILFNLIADILYGIADPRIKHRRTE